MNTLEQLKTIMAAHNYYMAADIPAEYNLDGCQLSKDKQWPNGIPANYAKGEFFKLYDYRGKKGVASGVDLVCLKDGSNIPISLYSEWRGKKHRFYLPNCLTCGISNNTTKKAADGIRPKPNEIGVFTQKKMDDWNAYLADLYTALNEKQTALTAAIAASQAQVEAEISTFKVKQRRTQSKFKVVVYTDSFEFTYDISETSGELYRRAEFRGKFDDALKFAQSI